MRNAVVVPEMVGAVVGVYNGRAFSNVEIKFDMIGRFISANFYHNRYLGEFALSYKATSHGKPGVGATKGS
jgi:small subunit ribosomal protein S15e